MITRVVRMQLRAGKASDFLSVFLEVNNAIRKSPGCISVSLFTEEDDPDTVVTISQWKSPEHLANYRGSELFLSTWRRVKPHFRAPAQAFSLNPVLT